MGNATPIVVFESAARTATVTSSELRVPGGVGGRGQFRGVVLIIDVTAVTATPSVVFSVEISLGPAGGGDAYASVLDSVAITAVGSTVLIVHPSVPTARANVLSQGPFKAKWRVLATHGDADSITYSVTALGLL